MRINAKNGKLMKANNRERIFGSGNDIIENQSRWSRGTNEEGGDDGREKDGGREGKNESCNFPSEDQILWEDQRNEHAIDEGTNTSLLDTSLKDGFGSCADLSGRVAQKPKNSYVPFVNFWGENQRFFLDYAKFKVSISYSIQKKKKIISI